MLSSYIEDYKVKLTSFDEGLIALDDDILFKKLEKYVFEDENIALSFSEKEYMVYEIYNSFRGFDVIQKYLEDPEISEIMLNSYESIYIEKQGQIIKTDCKFLNREKMLTIINRILGQVGKKVNKTSNIVDARLLDGSRINVILDPISLRGPTVTIRKFVLKNVTMNDLVSLSTLENDTNNLLDYLVKNRFNIFICGGTSSGKTTLLNALSSLIPRHERIITIEDSAELCIASHENCISLESKSTGKNIVDMSSLIKASLRMRPDRIIVGEVRGKEALDMLQAMNTGHDGSISTGHGNSNSDMLYRLETMVIEGSKLPLASVRRQIFSGIDVLVNIKKYPAGLRKIEEISYLHKMQDNKIVLRTLYSKSKKMIIELDKLEKLEKKID